MQKTPITLFFLGLYSLTLSLQAAQEPSTESSDATGQVLGNYQHYWWCVWKDRPCNPECTYCDTCNYKSPQKTTSDQSNHKQVKTKEVAFSPTGYICNKEGCPEKRIVFDFPGTFEACQNSRSKFQIHYTHALWCPFQGTLESEQPFCHHCRHQTPQKTTYNQASDKHIKTNSKELFKEKNSLVYKVEVVLVNANTFPGTLPPPLELILVNTSSS